MTPLPEWPEPGDETLTRISLKSFGTETKPVILENSSGNWYLPEEDREAGQEETEDLIGRLQTFQPVNRLAEKGPYERFGLGAEQAGRITLETNEGKGDFLIGKLSDSGYYTYVRREGDEAVYTVRGDWEKIAGTTAPSLQSRQILSLNPSEIRSFTFLKGNRVKVIRKGPEGWRDERGERPDFSRIESYTRRLGQLKCLSFLPEEPASPQEPLLKILIQTEESSVSIDLLEAAPGAYTARSDRIPDRFTLPRFDGDYLFNLSGF